MLRCAAGKVLMSQIQTIQQHYAEEFNIGSVIVPSTCATHPTPSGESITVQTSTLIVDEESYKQKFQAWSLEAEKFHKDKLSQFVDAHVGLIVNDPVDADRLMAKCEKLEVLNERKRKLFLHDAMQELPVDNDRAKNATGVS